VARRHRVALVQPASAAEERAELHVGVAVDARARRPTAQVGRDERVDDAGSELALEVEDVERDAELAGHAPRVLGRVERAAAPLELAVRVGDVVEAHPDTDRLDALLVQQRGGHGRIHAAGHGDKDAPGHAESIGITR
jgi:hypothetical protein